MTIALHQLFWRPGQQVSQSLLCWTAAVSLDLSLHTSDFFVDLNQQEMDVHFSQILRDFWTSSSCFRRFWSTLAEIQKKTGMWHMMWRLLDLRMCEMILLADACHWFSSWNIPPSEGHWIPEFQSHGWCIWRGSDGLLLVWWWSRWEQREAALLSWALTSTHPWWSLIHISNFFIIWNINVICFHPAIKDNTTYTPHTLLSSNLEVQDESPAEVCETVLIVFNQVHLSKWKHKHEIYILICFTLCPVQNELLHRNVFPIPAMPLVRTVFILSFTLQLGPPSV